MIPETTRRPDRASQAPPTDNKQDGQMIAIDSPWSEVESLVKRALRKMRKRDAALFQLRANERSITHRLALYLEKQFKGWNVDCEYSRIGEDPMSYKKVLLPTESGGSPFDMSGSRVYPDIVIHNRGQNGPRDNLLVIEAKTPWSQVSDDQDMHKLSAFTGHYQVKQLVQYRFGLFLKFGNDARVAHQHLFERQARNARRSTTGPMTRPEEPRKSRR
jgi:hypothetical protein